MHSKKLFNFETKITALDRDMVAGVYRFMMLWKPVLPF